MKIVGKTEQSGRALNSDDKPESCYCSALPSGSGLCIPCYTRWLAHSARKQSGLALQARQSHRAVPHRPNHAIVVDSSKT
jgi:hypothetical protein